MEMMRNYSQIKAGFIDLFMIALEVGRTMHVQGGIGTDTTDFDQPR